MKKLLPAFPFCTLLSFASFFIRSICCFLILNSTVSAQNVGINASGTPPNNAAMLDVDVSVLSPKKGILIPRVTLTDRVLMNPLPAAAQGLMVYQTNGFEGIYYNNSLTTTPNWIYVGNSNTNWSTSGNAGTSGTLNFIGTTDPQALYFRVNNQRSGFIDYNNAIGNQNMSFGYQALLANTVAGNNLAIGYQALYNQSFTNGGTPWDTYNVAVGNGALFSNQPSSQFDGSYNTAVGSQAMYNNTTGQYTTAFGTKALYSNTLGTRNTAEGMFAMYSNTVGSENVAVGYHALYQQAFTNGGVTFSSDNTAVGSNALAANNPTSSANGINNTAIGYGSLLVNTIGLGNVAVGSLSMAGNTAGSDNIAIGYEALYTQSYNNAGSPWSGKNIAIGNGALFSNQPINTFSGINNIAIGYQALNKNTSGNFNVAVGTTALTNNLTGFDNTALGTNALFNNTTGNYNTAVGDAVMQNNTVGQQNTSMGTNAMFNNTTAGSNTALGYQALVSQSFANNGTAFNSNNVAIGANALVNNQPNSITSGINNTAVGNSSLSTNTIGFNNTAIGYQADVSFSTLVNATAIGYNAKVATSNSLVLGGTGVDAVNVGIGCTSPGYRLHVIGDIASSGTVRTTNALVTGAISACSDVRFKEDIEPLQNSLNNIMKLEGVSYFWKAKEFPERMFTDKKQIGIVAQELEKVYPELVVTDKDGYKSVDYTRLAPVLIQAVKEQQEEIKEYRSKMQMMEERLARLEKVVAGK